ncbi:hypothetical protein K469DRAFT_711742, partial [Zopfia rhizophila CBS 207.26]
MKPVQKFSLAEESFEREKAQIASYEEGWDRWDGPMWPMGTVQCDLQSPTKIMAPALSTTKNPTHT